jgi:hypothetical protein
MTMKHMYELDVLYMSSFNIYIKRHVILSLFSQIYNDNVN